MSELRNQVALVTGSSRGIGAAIAKRFAAAGALAALRGREEEQALGGVASAILEAGGRAIVTTGDVTNFGTVESIRTHVEGELGPIDVGGSFTRRGTRGYSPRGLACLPRSTAISRRRFSALKASCQA